ncbi:response regulator [candidate division KSB3 bacterium]|uniref:Response regulator n=1 Tax=candidate division KSB3 bacterium TaxID=2044937 RepID=A0A9D5Q5K0_9BACT|nr:response regulator [candidate division KSB3 bacterium]MBD3324418.1 response regulator [candidate division KSB3 bacterium]
MTQKVLVADDSIASQRLFEMVLTREGYDVITVGSGAEVLDQIKAQHPDIALIDAVMPEVDGYQICETVRNTPNFQNLPLILLAGTHEDVDQEKGISLVGNQGILNKPAKSDAILSKVRELLTAHEAEEAQIAEEPSLPETPVAEGIQEEPPFVEEEYEFDEDSEEADLVVEHEILDEEAELEAEGRVYEIEEEVEYGEPLEEIEEEVVEEIVEEQPPQPEPHVPVSEPETAAPGPAAAPESGLSAELSDEKLDMIADEIAQRLAHRLVPVLVHEIAQYVMQFPMAKQVVEKTSKQLVKELLPEIQQKD